MMNPALKNTPAKFENAMIALCGKGFDPLTMASLWFSLYRTDQRPAIEKISVPLLYIMPESLLSGNDGLLGGGCSGSGGDIDEEMGVLVLDGLLRVLRSAEQVHVPVGKNQLHLAKDNTLTSAKIVIISFCATRCGCRRSRPRR